MGEESLDDGRFTCMKVKETWEFTYCVTATSLFTERERERERERKVE